jgi:hypothetical protein
VSPSVLMFIAEEYQALYRPAESGAFATQCIQVIDGNPRLPMLPANRDAILQRCRELQSAAANGLGRIRVLLPNNAPTETRVFVGGVVVPREAMAAPREVAIGDVDVEVTAPGHAVVRRRVTVRPNEVLDVQVQLSDLGSCTPHACPQAPNTVAAPSRTGPVVLMATGGALLLGSLAVWALGDRPTTQTYETCVMGRDGCQTECVERRSGHVSLHTNPVARHWRWRCRWGSQLVASHTHAAPHRCDSARVDFVSAARPG